MDRHGNYSDESDYNSSQAVRAELRSDINDAVGLIARQSTWQMRVNQDGKGSRGIRITPLMIVAGERFGKT